MGGEAITAMRAAFAQHIAEHDENNQDYMDSLWAAVIDDDPEPVVVLCSYQVGWIEAEDGEAVPASPEDNWAETEEAVASAAVHKRLSDTIKDNQIVRVIGLNRAETRSFNARIRARVGVRHQLDDSRCVRLHVLKPEPPDVLLEADPR